VPLRGEVAVVAASVGVSVYPHDGEEFADLLHAADLNMYERKAGAARP
jgi:GGDEF domain-containing protein